MFSGKTNMTFRELGSLASTGTVHSCHYNCHICYGSFLFNFPFVPWMSAERKTSKGVVEIIILHLWNYQLRIGENP
jgi:hypothetical protein